MCPLTTLHTSPLARIPVTKLVATHDLDVAHKTCTNAIVLLDGAIAESGSIDGILSDADLLQHSGLS